MYSVVIFSSERGDWQSRTDCISNAPAKHVSKSKLDTSKELGPYISDCFALTHIVSMTDNYQLMLWPRASNASRLQCDELACWKTKISPLLQTLALRGLACTKLGGDGAGNKRPIDIGLFCGPR